LTDPAPAGIVERFAKVETRLGEVGERLDRVVELHDTPSWL
jgi:hypothetical protein